MTEPRDEKDADDASAASSSRSREDGSNVEAAELASGGERSAGERTPPEASETSDQDAASSESATSDASESSDVSEASDVSESSDASEAGSSDVRAAESSDASEGEASEASDTTSSDVSESNESSEDATSDARDASSDEEASPSAARTLAEEADAARAAVEEASKPVERYPAPDARAQRLAGFGCMALMVLLTVGFAVVFRVAFRRITSLDTNLNGYEIETVAPGEARRQAARDSARPATRTAPAGSGVEWRTDLAAAFEEARRDGRPMLLHFEAGWATASRDMLDGTYANVAVREALASFVPVRIDLTEREPEEQELAQRFVVTALPHVVYLAPDGERLRPDSTTLVDASDMEIFLREALGAYEDGRRFTEPTTEPPPAP